MPALCHYYAADVARGRQIPRTPWSSDGSRWRTGPRTFAVLIVGLWLFGTGEALIINGGLGNSPWTTLAQGVTRHTSLGIGAATFVISGIILLLWIPLRERPGLGTLANAIVIAFALGLTVNLLPLPQAWPVQLAFVLLGTASIGLGSALYLTANLGPGPRDGLMTGIHDRTGWPVAAIRACLEVTVLSVGWLLGGRVGLGTVIFAFGVGPAISWWLRRMPRASVASPEA